MKRITISEYDKYYKEAKPFECNLKDFISVNDGMIEEEIDNLNNLKVSESVDISIHCGFCKVERIK